MKVHLQKVYIWDGKPKMQHYFFSHSTGKFLGENEASCASSSNVFLVHENALCKWTKFTCPKKVSLSLFFDLCFVLSLWAVFLDGMTTVCDYEVHYFPATSFFTVLMTRIRPEQQRKCKF